MDEDPKQAAKNELKRRDVQQDLRQFLKLESGLGNSPAFIRGHSRIFSEADDVFMKPVVCSSCTYKAETRKELEWHMERTNHLFCLPLNGNK